MGCDDLGVIGVAVRVHSSIGDDLGVANLPSPVEVGDELEVLIE
jgi:hypothetical protein